MVDKRYVTRKDKKKELKKLGNNIKRKGRDKVRASRQGAR